MSEILTADFFDRPTLEVTRDLLGKQLCRLLPDGRLLRWPLRELEAYDGPEDRACHAHRGQTPRNRVMFGPAGYWYVYLCYGVHWMLNVVTGPANYPAAVLIRGAGDVVGPGRLTKALQITKAQHEHAAKPDCGLWIEDDGVNVPERAIQRTPRIGIDYAGPEWVNAPYRLVWK